MREKIQQIQDEALAAINNAKELPALEEARVKYLGKKSEFIQLLKSLGSLPAKERPQAGALINEVKGRLETALREKNELLLL